MRNNILGGIVVFLVVLTCLLVLDDISQSVGSDPYDTVKAEETSQKNTGFADLD